MAKQFLCPFCFNSYDVNDIQHLCSEGRMSKPGFREREPIRCKHKGCSCDGYATHRHCPVCGNYIPSSLIDLPFLPFSIIGDQGSGKTTYITVMMKELEDASSNLDLLLEHLDDDTLRKREEDQRMLYSFGMLFEPTQAGEDPIPQIWRISNHARRTALEAPSYNFTISSRIYGDRELAAFIADGREEALRQAVRFLIDQYRKPVDQRKFLVVSDESTAFIEMWIAAIESAFSPRIAATIPFATRMENYAAANFYSVNDDGLFVRGSLPKMRRHRAMIVGVDTRAATNPTKPVEVSPKYMHLSGKDKRCYGSDASGAGDDAEAHSPYFNLITSFTHQHRKYCRTFLHMMDVVHPEDACTMYDVYLVLMHPKDYPLQRVLSALKDFSARRTGYPLSGEQTELLDEIAANIMPLFSDYFDRDDKAALEIFRWMERTMKNQDLLIALAPAVGEKLRELFYACNAALLPSIRALWESVEQTNLRMFVAHMLTEQNTVMKHIPQFAPSNTSMALEYLRIFLACSDSANSVNDTATYAFAAHCLTLYRSHSLAVMQEISALLNLYYANELRAYLLHLAVCMLPQNQQKAEYWVYITTAYEQNVATSDIHCLRFLEELRMRKLLDVAGPVFLARFDYVNGQSGGDFFIAIDAFMNALPQDMKINGRFAPSCTDFFEAVNQKIGIANTMHVEFAAKIVNVMPVQAKCSHAVYVCVSQKLLRLAKVAGKGKKPEDMGSELQALAFSGLTSPMTSTEESSFAERILGAGLSEADFCSMLAVLATPRGDNPYSCLIYLVKKLISLSSEKVTQQWNWFWKYACDMDMLHNDELRMAVATAIRAAHQAGESLWKKAALISDFDHSITFKVIAFESLISPSK